MNPSPQSQAAVAHVLHRDIETRSRTPLRKVGSDKYAADPATEVLCVAYAVDEGPVQLWCPGDKIPAEFLEAAAGSTWFVCAHGDAFETTIEQHVLAPRFGWPITPPERHLCTMAACAAVGLPAQLSAAANALELMNRKDIAGERLMHAMSKPRKPRKGEDPACVYWFEEKERLDRLYTYCQQDVEVERELHNRVPPLSAPEQMLWALSNRINQRGFPVDCAFAQAARRIAQDAVPEIDAELAKITSGGVTGINQLARMLQWLQQQGCAAPKLDRKTIEELLGAEELPPSVRRVSRGREVRCEFRSETAG